MNLSIIIPVYNVEKYVTKTLDSCLNQNFEDYEIIIVDDGSTDSTPDILDSYAEKHPERVRAFHKENGGVSSARNFGIEKARGKWIWFVDGDDWIAKACLKPIFDIAESDSYEFVRFEAESVIEDKKEFVYIAPEKKRVLNNAQIFSAGFEDSRYDCLWSYWFLRDRIVENNICFDISMKYSEDIQFIQKFKMYCVTGITLSATVYAYIQREGSAMHNIDHKNHMHCMKKMVEMCCEGIKRPEYAENYAEMRVMFLKMLLWDMLLYEDNYKNVKKYLNKLIADGCYPYKSRGDVVRGRSRKEKIASFMYKYVFPHKFLYLLICRIRFLIKKVKG